MDSERVEIPEIPGYISVKQAARRLGVTENRVYAYVNSGRLRAGRAGRGIAVLEEDVENFKPSISGRPTKNPPTWRIPPIDNQMHKWIVSVPLKSGKREEFQRLLERFRYERAHLFPGITARYISESNEEPGRIEIEFVRRGVTPEAEEAFRRDFAEFQQALAGVLDWEQARYSSSRVLMHT